jgi:hypothetical protein
MITYANKKELWVLIPTDSSTNLIHCIYEVHSKAHGIGALIHRFVAHRNSDKAASTRPIKRGTLRNREYLEQEYLE